LEPQRSAVGIVQEFTNLAPKQVQTITEHQEEATVAPRLATTRTETGVVQLTLTGQTNLLYVIHASTNLMQWTKDAVRTNLTGTVDYTPPPSSSPQRFYRVQVP